jgi:hypothetical protein
VVGWQIAVLKGVMLFLNQTQDLDFVPVDDPLNEGGRQYAKDDCD